MFDYRGLHDALFLMLYIGAGVLAMLAALYLLLRRRNLFMRESTTDGDRMVLAPNGEAVRLGHALRSSRRLRRWTAAALAAMALSHVWWYGVGQWWLADDRLVRTLLVIMPYKQ